jgi:hypothetical protein
MEKNRKMSFTIVSKSEKNQDLKYWLKQPPEKRIEAVEFLRSQYYAFNGYKTIPRFIPAVKMVRFHKK